MKISKSIKGKKITSISITFETDEEIGCLEDMVTLADRSIVGFFEFRTELPDVLSNIKKELE